MSHYRVVWLKDSASLPLVKVKVSATDPATQSVTLAEKSYENNSFQHLNTLNFRTSYHHTTNHVLLYIQSAALNKISKYGCNSTHKEICAHITT